MKIIYLIQSECIKNTLNNIKLDNYNTVQVDNVENIEDVLEDVHLVIVESSLCNEDLLKKLVDISVIVVARDKNEGIGEIEAFRQGVVDYIEMTEKEDLIKVKINNRISKTITNRCVEKFMKQKAQELEKIRYIMVNSIAELMEYRDATTGGHLKRTALYVELFLSKIIEHGVYKEFMTEEFIKNLIKSAPIHDIGKVGVSDSILLKRSRLTTDEFEDMKEHTILGELAASKMLSEIENDEFLNIVKDVVGSHHEYWNGEGYPKGLSGDNIPLAGRIMAIADLYDALTTERPYKKAYSHNDAVEIIKKERSKKLDPILVDLFIEVEKDFQVLLSQHYKNIIKI